MRGSKHRGQLTNYQWLRGNTGEWSTTDPAVLRITPVLATLTGEESELVNNF